MQHRGRLQRLRSKFHHARHGVRHRVATTISNIRDRSYAYAGFPTARPAGTQDECSDPAKARYMQLANTIVRCGTPTATTPAAAAAAVLPDMLQYLGALGARPLRAEFSRPTQHSCSKATNSWDWGLHCACLCKLRVRCSVPVLMCNDSPTHTVRVTPVQL